MSQVLDALTANPEVWSKPVFFLMYDENDGFFDHIVPPNPPESSAQGFSTVATTNELFAGDAHFAAGPYGLGVRVPMIVISPWSKGGFVNSEVSDHTSLIRFIERRFGVVEPNITPWRRAITGDLTSAFNFESPNSAVVALPSTTAYAPPDYIRHNDYNPAPPSEQVLPKQEPGARPARALPYEFRVDGDASTSQSTVKLRFHNTGKAAAVFQVRFADGQTSPKTYTVGADEEASDTIPVNGQGYDLSVHGPNGFLRSFAGGLVTGNANLSVRAEYERESGGIALEIRNHRSSPEKVSIFDAYTGKPTTHQVEPNDSFSHFFQLHKSYGWYDLTIKVESDGAFQRQLAGHLETGRDSMSDPAIGAV